MDRELGVLFLAFVPGIVLVIAGAISAVRQYGIVFLWCLGFEPVREKLTSIVREMQPTGPVVSEQERNVESELERPYVSGRYQSHRTITAAGEIHSRIRRVDRDAWRVRYQGSSKFGTAFLGANRG